MLTLPIYKRGSIYVLHTRIAGKQFKRSLKTGNADEAKLRAIALLRVALMSKLKLSDLPLDVAALKRYELEISPEGQVTRLKADTPDEHARLMEALSAVRNLGGGPARAATAESSDHTLSSIYEFFLLQEKPTVATERSYTGTLNELKAQFGEVKLDDIDDEFVNAYMLWLFKPKPTGLGNSKATVDKKIGTVKTIVNWAISSKRYFRANAFSGRNTRTKAEKLAAKGTFYTLAELKRMFDCDAYRMLEKTDPDFYWILFLGLITGGRVTSLARLASLDLMRTIDGVPYLMIWNDKTEAGQRDVPIPEEVFVRLEAWAAGRERVFKFRFSEERGASDDVLDLLKPYLVKVGVTRPKLTFHSFRRTANDYFLKSDLSYEIRTQFVGHKPTDVNRTAYATSFSTDQIAAKVLPLQRKLLRHLGFALREKL